MKRLCAIVLLVASMAVALTVSSLFWKASPQVTYFVPGMVTHENRSFVGRDNVKVCTLWKDSEGYSLCATLYVWDVIERDRPLAEFDPGVVVWMGFTESKKLKSVRLTKPERTPVRFQP